MKLYETQISRKNKRKSYFHYEKIIINSLLQPSDLYLYLYDNITSLLVMIISRLTT